MEPGAFARGLSPFCKLVDLRVEQEVNSHGTSRGREPDTYRARCKCLAINACEHLPTPTRRARATAPDGLWHGRAVASMRPAPTGIAVYDGAFSPAAGERLAGTDIRTLGSYRRSRGARTATEHFIESLLHELGEACEEVEYWGREVWRPVPAHADIDERCARERGQLRFPAAVLVVYVQVERRVRVRVGARVRVIRYA